MLIVIVVCVGVAVGRNGRHAVMLMVMAGGVQQQKQIERADNASLATRLMGRWWMHFHVCAGLMVHGW